MITCSLSPGCLRGHVQPGFLPSLSVCHQDGQEVLWSGELAGRGGSGGPVLCVPLGTAETCGARQPPRVCAQTFPSVGSDTEDPAPSTAAPWLTTCSARQQVRAARACITLPGSPAARSVLFRGRDPDSRGGALPTLLPVGRF